MIIYAKHNVYLPGDHYPIFKHLDRCILSIDEVINNQHSDNGYIMKGIKYVICNYSNTDNMVEFFIGDDDEEDGINIINMRNFLENFISESEFRAKQILSKKLELSN